MTAAAEARALAGRTNVATLATLSEDGSPWASLVAFAADHRGAPVLCVSDLAEHGRNLACDPRASLVVAQAVPPDADPLAAGRVTLTGRVERPAGDEAGAARAAYLAAVSGADTYISFADFTLWVLRAERVRWVGGFGRMQTVDPAEYASAAV
jgi:putative heme iron utilization protein